MLYQNPEKKWYTSGSFNGYYISGVELLISIKHLQPNVVLTEKNKTKQTNKHICDICNS